jgi:preprotein translocase subunit SecF
MRLLRLVPDNTKIGFMALRTWAFPFSAIISILCIVGFIVHGLNVGIDFKGGSLLELQAKSGQANVQALRTTMHGLNLGEVQIQEFGGPATVLIRYAEQPGGDPGQRAAADKVRGVIAADYEVRRLEVVGPRVSGELVQLSTIGVVLSILVVLIYLWFRFEWQFAVGAMVATVHDLVAIIGFYTYTGTDFDMTSIAALLTVVGYSLNDTVVIYDRIREMLRKYKKMPLADLLDLSINATLARTIATSMTTFLALLGLYFFGGEVISGFTSAMLVGVVVGTYSSIFVAAPVLIYLGIKPETTKETAKEVAKA